jgi:hypothetical protein
MKKRFTPALVTVSALATAVLTAVPAFAGIYYVPSPDLNGGRQETHVEVSPGGPRQLTPIFIPTGADGSRLNGNPAKVDNDEKPNVFNVRNFIDGVGMLKLVGATGIQVRSSTMFLTLGSNSVNWALPVLSEVDWFTAGETAYMKGLAKNSVGASNIEIINFSPAASTCQVQLVKPKGGALGAARSFDLRPVSHLVIKDALNGFLETPSAGNVRAEVSCNREFYAYATYLEASLASFRMLYPLSAPSVADSETLTINRPGTFFSPTQANGALDIVLPLVPNRAYRKVTIDYDVNIRDFTPLFTGVLGMFHPGGPRFGKTLYFGTFIRGLRARTLVDQGSPVIEPALKFGTGWKEGATHHVAMVYDTEAGTLRFQASRNGAIIADYTGSVYNYDLADRGSPVRLAFGLNGIADGAYYPPAGWKFSNLRVVITR